MTTTPYVPKTELVARLAELDGIYQNCILKNEKSRIFGQIVLELYAQLTGLTIPSQDDAGDGWETILGDALGDLRHFADGVGVNFDERIDRGEMYYEEEMEAVFGSRHVCGGCAGYLATLRNITQAVPSRNLQPRPPKLSRQPGATIRISSKRCPLISRTAGFSISIWKRLSSTRWWVACGQSPYFRPVTRQRVHIAASLLEEVFSP